MERRAEYAFDLPFLLIAGGLLLFGLIMLSSASGPVGYENFGDSYYFLKHQVLFGLVPGIIGLIFFSKLPYQRLEKYAFPLLLATIF